MLLVVSLEDILVLQVSQQEDGLFECLINFGLSLVADALLHVLVDVQ